MAHEQEIEEKDAEIEKLKAQLSQLAVGGYTQTRESLPTALLESVVQLPATARRGKAPPVNEYTSENSEVWWED